MQFALCKLLAGPGFRRSYVCCGLLVGNHCAKSQAFVQCTGALCAALQLKVRFAWISLAVCDCVHGECSSGVTGNGSCTCYGGYTGPRCDQGKHTGSCRGAVMAKLWAWIRVSQKELGDKEGFGNVEGRSSELWRSRQWEKLEYASCSVTVAKTSHLWKEDRSFHLSKPCGTLLPRLYPLAFLPAWGPMETLFALISKYFVK